MGLPFSSSTLPVNSLLVLASGCRMATRMTRLSCSKIGSVWSVLEIDAFFPEASVKEY